MNFKHLLFLFSSVLIFNSCSEDTDCCPMPEPETDFASGTLVLNEGNFGSANASVSFINEGSGVQQHQIFKETNGFDLGDTAQSLELHEDLAIIVVNVSSKIEIVNRYSFESLGTIATNLSNPRYAEVVGQKLYVTNWGDGTNPADDYVAVFDLEDYAFIGSIPVTEGPEKLIAANNKIYVAHKGGFSFNNIISVLDITANQVSAELEVGDVPNSMLVSGTDLWVLSSGKPAYADMETAGELSRIDTSTDEVKQSLKFGENNIHPENLSSNGTDVYLTIGKSLYKYTPGTNLPETPAFSFEEPALLYGFAIRENKIYIASPNTDFTGDGNLYIYNMEGELVDQYSTGINPNGVYFN